MARAWVVDRWLKDATAQNGDGGTMKVPPPSSTTRALSNADPFKPETLRKVPEQYRTKMYGQGRRWRVNWYETSGDGRKHLPVYYTPLTLPTNREV